MSKCSGPQNITGTRKKKKIPIEMPLKENLTFLIQKYPFKLVTNIHLTFLTLEKCLPVALGGVSPRSSDDAVSETDAVCLEF